MRAIAWIGAVALLGALYALYRKTSARADRAEVEIAALKQAIAKSQSPAFEKRETAFRGLEQVPTSIAIPLPVELPKEASPAPRKGAASHADQLAYYHASLQAEAVDVAWSRASTRQLRALFDRVAGKATSLRTVECRQTICRVELTHDTEPESLRFMDEWVTSEAQTEWHGPLTGGVVETSIDGSARSVFFFAREGTELPELD